MEEEKNPRDCVSPTSDVLTPDGILSESEFKVNDVSEKNQGYREEVYPMENPAHTETPHSDSNMHRATDLSPNSTDSLKRFDEKLDGIITTEQKLFGEVREMHRLYHNEFAGRLKSMQDELEQYRKADKGRIFDDILGEIARIYGNNETLADEVQDPKIKKSIRYLLLDLEDLLGVYGMSMLRSSPGDKRNPRHCQVHERIPTDDPAKHDTVAKSYNTGFFVGNRTVIKEIVDIYFYDGSADRIQNEENLPDETDENLTSE